MSSVTAVTPTSIRHHPSARSLTTPVTTTTTPVREPACPEELLMATSTEIALTLANRLDRSVSRALPPALVRHPHVCPACGYSGRFSTAWAMTGRRAEAYCPACHAAERHRLQALVVERLAPRYD